MNGLRTRFYRKKLFKEPVLKFFLGISEKKDEFSLNLGNFLFTLQLELCPVGTCKQVLYLI